VAARSGAERVGGVVARGHEQRGVQLLGAVGVTSQQPHLAAVDVDVGLLGPHDLVRRHPRQQGQRREHLQRAGRGVLVVSVLGGEDLTAVEVDDGPRRCREVGGQRRRRGVDDDAPGSLLGSPTCGPTSASGAAAAGAAGSRTSAAATVRPAARRGSVSTGRKVPACPAGPWDAPRRVRARASGRSCRAAPRGAAPQHDAGDVPAADQRAGGASVGNTGAPGNFALICRVCSSVSRAVSSSCAWICSDRWSVARVSWATASACRPVSSVCCATVRVAWATARVCSTLRTTLSILLGELVERPERLADLAHERQRLARLVQDLLRGLGSHRRIPLGLHGHGQALLLDHERLLRHAELGADGVELQEDAVAGRVQVVGHLDDVGADPASRSEDQRERAGEQQQRDERGEAAVARGHEGLGGRLLLLGGRGRRGAPARARGAQDVEHGHGTASQ
jgi:hypothetical protein